MASAVPAAFPHRCVVPVLCHRDTSTTWGGRAGGAGDALVLFSKWLFSFPPHFSSPVQKGSGKVVCSNDCAGRDARDACWTAATFCWRGFTSSLRSARPTDSVCWWDTRGAFFPIVFWHSCFLLMLEGGWKWAWLSAGLTGSESA